jgi:hypothetical protein
MLRDILEDDGYRVSYILKLWNCISLVYLTGAILWNICNICVMFKFPQLRNIYVYVILIYITFRASHRRIYNLTSFNYFNVCLI